MTEIATTTKRDIGRAVDHFNDAIEQGHTREVANAYDALKQSGQHRRAERLLTAAERTGYARLPEYTQHRTILEQAGYTEERIEKAYEQIEVIARERGIPERVAALQEAETPDQEAFAAFDQDMIEIVREVDPGLVEVFHALRQNQFAAEYATEQFNNSASVRTLRQIAVRLINATDKERQAATEALVHLRLNEQIVTARATNPEAQITADMRAEARLAVENDLIDTFISSDTYAYNLEIAAGFRRRVDAETRRAALADLAEIKLQILLADARAENPEAQITPDMEEAAHAAAVLEALTLKLDRLEIPDEQKAHYFQIAMQVAEGGNMAGLIDLIEQPLRTRRQRARFVEQFDLHEDKLTDQVVAFDPRAARRARVTGTPPGTGTGSASSPERAPLRGPELDPNAPPVYEHRRPVQEWMNTYLHPENGLPITPENPGPSELAFPVVDPDGNYRDPFGTLLVQGPGETRTQFIDRIKRAGEGVYELLEVPGKILIVDLTHVNSKFHRPEDAPQRSEQHTFQSLEEFTAWANDPANADLTPDSRGRISGAIREVDTTNLFWVRRDAKVPTSPTETFSKATAAVGRFAPGAACNTVISAMRSRRLGAGRPGGRIRTLFANTGEYWEAGLQRTTAFLTGGNTPENMAVGGLVNFATGALIYSLVASRGLARGLDIPISPDGLPFIDQLRAHGALASAIIWSSIFYVKNFVVWRKALENKWFGNPSTSTTVKSFFGNFAIRSAENGAVLYFHAPDGADQTLAVQDGGLFLWQTPMPIDSRMRRSGIEQRRRQAGIALDDPLTIGEVVPFLLSTLSPIRALDWFSMQAQGDQNTYTQCLMQKSIYQVRHMGMQTAGEFPMPHLLLQTIGKFTWDAIHPLETAALAFGGTLARELAPGLGREFGHGFFEFVVKIADYMTLRWELLWGLLWEIARNKNPIDMQTKEQNTLGGYEHAAGNPVGKMLPSLYQVEIRPIMADAIAKELNALNPGLELTADHVLPHMGDVHKTLNLEVIGEVGYNAVYTDPNTGTAQCYIHTASQAVADRVGDTCHVITNAPSTSTDIHDAIRALQTAGSYIFPPIVMVGPSIRFLGAVLRVKTQGLRGIELDVEDIDNISA